MSVPKLLTANQLAEALGLHPKVVARHTRSGRYAAFAVNLADGDTRPIWRYDLRRLEKWLEGRRTSGA